MSLTPPERETVILFSDEDTLAKITTYQKPILTALERNPAAKLIESYEVEGTKGAQYELPAKLVSLRKPMKLSPEAKAARRAAGLRLQGQE